MADHAQTTVEVDDIWFKTQRVFRTLVQVGIPSFLGFALVLPQIIGALGLPVDSALYLWLVGAAAAVTAVATGLSRVMAIPAVNAWLVKIGLGSVPKSEAVVPDKFAGLTVNGDPADGSAPDAAENPGPGDALVEGDGLAK